MIFLYIYKYLYINNFFFYKGQWKSNTISLFGEGGGLVCYDYTTVIITGLSVSLNRAINYGGKIII